MNRGNKNLKKKFKNIHTLDVYVAFSIISLIVYTIISQIIAAQFNIILDTLTTCFFGFFGGEIVTCGLIKIFKLYNFNKNIDTINITNQQNNSVG